MPSQEEAEMKRFKIDVSIKISIAACLFGIAAILSALR